jgi:dipeptidyl aminopeptidase/acylaminoacyl peptidase
LELGRSEVIRWLGKDGLEIEGILLYPIGYKTGLRVTLIASSRRAFRCLVAGVPTQRQQLSARRGWAVFMPNIRGSSGYGEKFQLVDLKDWGWRD